MTWLVEQARNGAWQVVAWTEGGKLIVRPDAHGRVRKLDENPRGSAPGGLGRFVVTLVPLDACLMVPPGCKRRYGTRDSLLRMRLCEAVAVVLNKRWPV